MTELKLLQLQDQQQKRYKFDISILRLFEDNDKVLIDFIPVRNHVLPLVSMVRSDSTVIKCSCGREEFILSCKPSKIFLFCLDIGCITTFIQDVEYADIDRSDNE